MRLCGKVGNGTLGCGSKPEFASYARNVEQSRRTGGELVQGFGGGDGHDTRATGFDCRAEMPKSATIVCGCAIATGRHPPQTTSDSCGCGGAHIQIGGQDPARAPTIKDIRAFMEVAVQPAVPCSLDLMGTRAPCRDLPWNWLECRTDGRGLVTQPKSNTIARPRGRCAPPLVLHTRDATGNGGKIAIYDEPTLFVAWTGAAIGTHELFEPLRSN